MTNFIFKSSTTFKKISNQLEMILSEQRKQRADLQYLLQLVKSLKNDKNLQKMVDDWYDKDPVPEDTADLD